MGWKDAPEVQSSEGWARAPEVEQPGVVASIGAGLGKGFGQTVLGLQHYIGKGVKSAGDALAPARDVSSLVAGQAPTNLVQDAGRWLINDAASGRTKLEGELQPYKDANPFWAGAGEVGGEVVATLPVGGALAAPLKVGARFVPALAPLADAVATAGMRAKGAAGLPAFATRMAGGAATGGASASLVNPGDGGVGAAVGAAMPLVGKIASKAGEAVGSAVRPLFKSGQERVAGQALREFAADPQAAIQALKSAQQIIPGSAPTAAMAAGDPGLAALARTVQNVSGDNAAEMAIRQSAQNSARTHALEAVAANPGKLAVAKAARDAATDQLREQALASAGKLDANAITSRIERMMADPNNAGATARSGLQRALNQIKDIAGDSGAIDSRALYEIRKDIGLAMNGKLQGDAGNLRYARGTLDRVQTLIDNAIEGAINTVPQSASRAVALPGANVALPGAAAGAARPSWRQYLSEYTRQSVPINQMERVADVMQRIQTGTVDASGNLVLSAAKLNNILKSEGQDLMKELAPQQIDLLRRLASDLNAQQIAASAGKAVGSNTVQNLASAGALKGMVGNGLSASTPVQSLLARPVNWLYKKADQGIVDKLGEAMLDPQTAAQLMEQAGRPGAVEALFNRPGVRQIGYRAAPVLSAQ